MSYRIKIATVYMLGFFLDLINLFVASVAYPHIASDLDTDVTELSWIGTGYILGLTLIIPLSSWLSKRYGARNTLLLSLALFTFGTAGAGMAGSTHLLIAWRVLQGLGGGLLIPVGQTLTYQHYRSDERAGLSSFIMLIALFAPALSPVAGGIIVDYLGWRWIFFLNLPLALLTLCLAAFWLKTDKQHTQPLPSFDFYSFFTGSLGLVFLLVGLSQLTNKETFHSGTFGVLTGLTAIAVFIKINLKKTPPVLNLRLTNDLLMRTSMLVYLFIPGVFIGISMITMLYLQSVLGMPAADTGLLMLPWSLTSFIAISLTGKFYNQCGPRPLFVVGCILQGFGIALLSQTHKPDQYPLFIIAFALMGFGGSLCSSTAQSTAFLKVQSPDLADASAIWNINRQLAFAFGIALLSLFLNIVLSWYGVSDVTNPSETAVAIQAFHTCFLIIALTALIPLAICTQLPNREILDNVQSQK
ncbi:major Facilitator Superfamily protein (plasmid) [Ochrobactrum quorumnocens]|uniref:Major Facilitator Superfamily protein n=1 Tax=Ochrobactrum quorumnocens TaxID=271865 RepID=A0A248ULP0_9HYPH|nr:MFS transporter [[Ochrobactrum] quorumnocens]ASV87783.1 major Facilitator Superfamily protein [[Ochrobactrum] quorumnocens]